MLLSDMLYCDGGEYVILHITCVGLLSTLLGNKWVKTQTKNDINCLPTTRLADTQMILRYFKELTNVRICKMKIRQKSEQHKHVDASNATIQHQNLLTC